MSQPTTCRHCDGTTFCGGKREASGTVQDVPACVTCKVKSGLDPHQEYRGVICSVCGGTGHFESSVIAAARGQQPQVAEQAARSGPIPEHVRSAVQQFAAALGIPDDLARQPAINLSLTNILVARLYGPDYGAVGELDLRTVWECLTSHYGTDGRTLAELARLAYPFDVVQRVPGAIAGKKYHITTEAVEYDKLKRAVSGSVQAIQKVTRALQAGSGAGKGSAGGLDRPAKSPPSVWARLNRQGGYLFLWLLILIGGVVAFAESSGKDRSMIYVFAGGTALLVFPLIICEHGLRNRCPKCRKWWAKTHADTEVVDVQDDWATETTYDVTRNTRGETMWETRREQVVPVSRVTERYRFACVVCGHQWSKYATGVIKR